jgi:phosphoglycolate phosphatase
MKFKAVLFDLDGTLLDTIEDLTDSMNMALGRLGYPGHDPETCKKFVGDGVEKFALRALPDNHRDDSTVEKCVNAMREEYKTRWANKTKPYDGIPELLDALTTHQKKMAVLSNKPDDSTREMVAKMLWRWRFYPVYGARPSVPKKPEPDSALEISQRLAVPPKEVLYLGDTGTDMKTARAAGMFGVGALWGFRTAEEIKESGAEALVEHPMEVLGLL